ncbi:MAG TPA: hypothetical protein V6D17_05610, partial [Candidatus Obscuribacterales bacterium]
RVRCCEERDQQNIQCKQNRQFFHGGPAQNLAGVLKKEAECLMQQVIPDVVHLLLMQNRALISERLGPLEMQKTLCSKGQPRIVRLTSLLVNR